MDLSEKLKFCRTNAKLTQKQVADQLNVSRKTISGWENGHSYPDTASIVKLSDIYDISLDDLLRDDRLLEYYREQDHAQTANHKILIGSYYLNLMLWLLSYIEFFRPAGFHSPLIPLMLLINTIVYLTHFLNWKRFLEKTYTIKAVVIFIFILIGHIALNAIDSSFLNYLSQAELHFLVGFVMGRLLLIILISLSLEILLFFRPVSRNS